MVDAENADDDENGHPENQTNLGQNQLKCAYVDVVDVSNAKLSVEVFCPQQLQVRHHKLPQLQDIVPGGAHIQVFLTFRFVLKTYRVNLGRLSMTTVLAPSKCASIAVLTNNTNPNQLPLCFLNYVYMLPVLFLFAI